MVADEMTKRSAAKWILLAVIGFASADSLLGQSSGESRSRSDVTPDDNTGCVAIPNPSGSSPRQVSGGVLNSKAIELPDPIGGKPSGKGNLAVQVLVGEDGAVVAASGVSGDKRYFRAAVDAARKAKFKPTLLSRTPVRVTGIIFYKF